MTEIIIGSVYRHYKSTGGQDYTYEVVGVALHTETGEKLVVYKPLYLCDTSLFARPLCMFLDLVEVDGVVKGRFELVGQV